MRMPMMPGAIVSMVMISRVIILLEQVSRCFHGSGFFTVTVFRVDCGERGFNGAGALRQ